MTTTMKKARPTEYKGIKFRSKSEAIIARNFDLLGLAWEYEPPVPGEWKPDFYLFGVNTLLDEGMYVEYKPTECTETYKAELAQRFAAMKDMQRKNAQPCEADYIRNDDCVLVCFNPFGSVDFWDAEIFVLQRGVMRQVHDCRMLAGQLLLEIDRAKEYRFDLYHKPELDDNEYPF